MTIPGAEVSGLADHIRDVKRFSMCSEPQLAYLFMLAMLAPDGIAVECGVYQGGSLFAWAQARIGRGRIIAVDSYMPPRWERELIIFREQIVARKLNGQIDLLRMSSWDAPNSLPDNVAFCFIDSDHSADGFPSDLEAWPRKIKPGGILVLHDYDVANPNVVVKRFADIWHELAQWEIIGNFHSTMAYRRPYDPE